MGEKYGEEKVNPKWISLNSPNVNETGLCHLGFYSVLAFTCPVYGFWGELIRNDAIP